MQIKSAKFIGGFKEEQELPYRDLPYFVVIGKSNVGKSSFINSLTGKKDLAYSGSKPGVTQQANIFLLNEKIYLADLPGYGYAKLSYKQRLELEDLIFWFLSASNTGGLGINFKKIFLLIDAEVGPTQLDLSMGKFLLNQETVIIANKIDKLKANQLNKNLKNIELHFNGLKIIPYSSKTGQGKKEVLNEFEISLTLKKT